MGVDKRLIDVAGEPMIRRVAGNVAGSADEVVVVVADSRPLPQQVLGGLAARIAVDRRSDAGPLAGLEAGLLAAAHELTLVVAADMPWLEPDVLRRLIERLGQTDADAVVARTDLGSQPLLAAYRRQAALSAATRLLDAGERRMRTLLTALRIELVDVPERVASNVNEPADIRADR
jgi:molybdopterin-guanine dinucleotide biosynthesis protein A